MGLRIFSVTGEALHFGGRRMETIVRLAWLPLVLSMMVTMAMVFVTLSVVAGGPITFADVPSYAKASELYAKHSGAAYEARPALMWTVTFAAFAAQAILTASFMAPLIRYAGLGEKPAPGFVRLPFGADQARYIVSSVFSFLFLAAFVLAPILIASYFALDYISAALSKTVAVFPDAASLHTIEVKPAGATLAERGLAWMYETAVPVALVAPFAIALWLILFLHFAPKNRPAAPAKGNPVLRAIVTLLAASPVIALVYLLLRQEIMAHYKAIAALSAEAARNLSVSAVDPLLVFVVMAFVIAAYFNLRLTPYPGVAVCRKSLGLGGSLKVSRGWNIFRLAAIIVFMALLLAFIQAVVVNLTLLQAVLPWTVNLLYQATAVSTKLVNSGVTADWVRPLFVWIWTGVQLLVNFAWLFFSYGVTAGLYGRLYRESEAGH